jgi:serine/threonine protein kinase
MKTSTFAGTHQFLAPEVTSGKDDYDGEKVDVWAAGVTL